MYFYHGQCSCGQVAFDLRFEQQLSECVARKCDCDFCMERDISYLSNSNGYLTIKTVEVLKSYHQGSMQAQFLACANCDDVICASYQNNGQLIGSLNATLLEDFSAVGKLENISPKKLSEEDKLTRWKAIWMPITIEDK